MKKLAVDLAGLAMAFEDAALENSYFLDMETGKVIWISEETRWELEGIYEEAYDPEADERVDLAQVLQDANAPDWQQELLLEADAVERFYGSRYIRVPSGDSREAYRDIEAFISTVEDERLQNELSWAIGGPSPFRRFKDVLADHYREQKRWYFFHDARLEERMLDWLKGEGIEAIIPEPALVDEMAPPEPTPRERLLVEVLAFTQAASRLPGVMRIALIGSLTTEEPDPKDADVLVTVADEVDLAPLAALGRKLQGHAQGLSRGGEVFLADPRGGYLGRTCPWKRCGPGIRLSCDALHCGRRHYLHDDLEAIHLAGRLIAAPPIELWPAVVTRVPVPEDVERELLLGLREEQNRPQPPEEE